MSPCCGKLLLIPSFSGNAERQQKRPTTHPFRLRCRKCRPADFFDSRQICLAYSETQRRTAHAESTGVGALFVLKCRAVGKYSGRSTCRFGLEYWSAFKEADSASDESIAEAVDKLIPSNNTIQPLKLSVCLELELLDEEENVRSLPFFISEQ